LLVLTIAAARFLGPERMGTQSFIAFAGITAGIVFTGGLPIALMRYIGETLGKGQGGKVRALNAWAWKIAGIGAAAGGGALVAAALIGEKPTAAWVLAAVVCAVGILHNVPTSVLIGAQHWRRASIVGLVTGSVSTVAVIAVLAAGGGITGMFAVEAIVSLGNLAWTTRLARRSLDEIAPQAEPADELRGQVARYAIYSSLSVSLSLIIWGRSEFFFLKHYSSDTQIALYSIPFSVVIALMQFPTAISTVAAPAVATLFGARERNRIRVGYSRALRLLLLFTLPMTAGVLALGPELLRLVFGNAYRETGPVLLILVSTFPVIPLISLSRGLLTGFGRLRFPLTIGSVAAAVNLGLDQLLIPAHAAIGAALANTAAQLVAGLPVLIYANRLLGVRLEAGAVLRPAAASVAGGAVAWTAVMLVGGAGGVLLGLPAGILAFGLVAVTLRILATEDAVWLEEAAGHRLHGWVARASRLCAVAPADAAPVDPGSRSA
jgi:O-antigen/teichoic acid export membrane protein